MGVSIRYMFATGLLALGPSVAQATSADIDFKGTVSDGGGLKPARATITSFIDRAAIDIVVANTGSTAVLVEMSASTDAAFAPARLKLAPGGQEAVRAVIELDSPDTGAVSVCAVRTDPHSGAMIGRDCGRYAIRRLSLD